MTESDVQTVPEPQPEQSPPSDPPVAPVEPTPDPPVGPAPPAVRVDNLTRRSDDDALEGHFVKVVSGEYVGRVGGFERVLSSGPDGYPIRILVRTRDAENELLTVAYADVRPADPYRGGR